tara:strand:+ start:655 stop:795 length:141 start_codon:yes stop_codon:yes gene_type:complete
VSKGHFESIGSPVVIGGAGCGASGRVEGDGAEVVANLAIVTFVYEG